LSYSTINPSDEVCQARGLVRFTNTTADSLLEQELRDQGDALARSAKTAASGVAAAATLLRRTDVTHVVIAARGSSDNAARYGQYLLGAEARLTVGLATPWLFRSGGTAPRLDGAAVIGISQSGSSPDVVGVLAAARAQGRPAIALSNDPDSALAAEADVVVELGVGVERSVAATKTYLASVQALASVVSALEPSHVTGAWLERLPQLVSVAVTEQLERRDRFDALAGCNPLTAVGRGLDFAAACESALKLRELSGIPAEAFSPPDLIHGPVGALDRATGLWIVVGAAKLEADALEALARIRARTGPTVAVAADPRVLELASVGVPLADGLPDWVAAIVAVIPAQAAALRLAERRGVEVDHPHGLTKVTLTR
jgi:glucosamine--fructose-6-phosphate aminotransferase (isomerizing)